jgi:hypothetical protein
MNETSGAGGGASRPFLTAADGRDVLARVVAAGEELPFEPDQAAAILADLEADLGALVEGAAS